MYPCYRVKAIGLLVDWVVCVPECPWVWVLLNDGCHWIRCELEPGDSLGQEHHWFQPSLTHGCSRDCGVIKEGCHRIKGVIDSGCHWAQVTFIQGVIEREVSSRQICHRMMSFLDSGESSRQGCHRARGVRIRVATESEVLSSQGCYQFRIVIKSGVL